LILYGSAMSNGNAHDHHPLPVLLVGGANGAMKGGRHIATKDAPMSNILLTMLDKVGIDAEFFGDSTGKIEI
jgi:hypothetical protein